jgi:hypothetical protein
MQDLYVQADKTSERLNETGGIAAREAVVMLGLLLENLLKYRKNKQKIKVERTESIETENMQDSLKTDMDNEQQVAVSRKEIRELTPEEKANDAILNLNKSLANHKTYEQEFDINGNKYKVNKFQGGALSIESEDRRSKTYLKHGNVNLVILTNSLLEICQRLAKQSNEI